VGDTLSAMREEINNCFGEEEKEELKSIRDNFNNAWRWPGNEGHMLPPKRREHEKICIYVKTEDGWEKADAMVNGRHVLIPTKDDELEFAVVKTGFFEGL
jgi:hypothetical protein